MLVFVLHIQIGGTLQLARGSNPGASYFPVLQLLYPVNLFVLASASYFLSTY